MAVTEFDNAVVENPVEAALEALKSGKPVDKAVYGKEIDGPEDIPDSREEEPVYNNSLELEDALITEEQESASDISETESIDSSSLSESEPESLLDSSLEKAPEALEERLDIEEIMVKGENGRKQKLKVDYSDRKAIKQAFLKASGMRKYQKERDNAIKSARDLTEKYESISKDFNKLEKIFESGGIKGLVEQLGGEGAWSKAVDAELEHRNYVDNLTPAEKYQLDLQERETKYQKMLEAEKQKREEFEKQIQQREEESAIRKMEAQLHPSFDRYRFAGKLGDEVTEHQFDTAIWNSVTRRLQEYPDDFELTQSVIDKEFRTVANNFRKYINNQAEKKVKSTIERKKADAGKRAQIAVKKGMTNNEKNRKFLDDMKRGNMTDALKSVLMGDVRFK